MKHLIVYKSRHGTTHKVAELLASKLGKEQTTLVTPDNDQVENLASYDTIIIGGSIHGGRIQNEIREFCEVNLDVLLQKRIGLFLCSMVKEKEQEAFKNAFPEALRQHAIAHGYFGGELLIDRMNFIDKTMVKIVSQQKENVSDLRMDAIDEFQRKIKGEV